MTKTQERLLPELEFVDGEADVSQWFGAGAKYEVEDDTWSKPVFSPKFHASGPITRNMVTCRTDDEAKQAAQDHFHARLLKPMDFGDAMKAVVRGCEVRQYETSKGQRLSLDGNSLRWLNPSGSWAFPFTPTNDSIKRPWCFYFPSKPAEPERVEARIIVIAEYWHCPNCSHEQCVDITSPQMNEIECSASGGGCGVTLHRPKEPND